jgi:hypothetical protein
MTPAVQKLLAWLGASLLLAITAGFYYATGEREALWTGALIVAVLVGLWRWSRPA